MMAQLGKLVRVDPRTIWRHEALDFTPWLAEGQRFFSENQRRWFGEGEAKGKAEAILLVLEGRGLPVSAAQRQAILACTDVASLDGWLKRAATVASAEQLLA